jgi:rRNA maturation endonuclease Nob1
VQIKFLPTCGGLEMPSVWTMFNICRKFVKLVESEENRYKLICEECGYEFSDLFQTNKICPKCGIFGKTKKIER